MTKRMALAAVLGAWLAGTFFMWSVAMQNFRVVDRILAEPPQGVEQAAEPLPVGDLRPVMRYQASEVNRLFFEGWGWVQVGLGAIAAALAWAGGAVRLGRWLVSAATLVALFLQLHVVPQTIRLGVQMDFGEAPADVVDLFWTYHHLYTGFDMAKAVTLLAVLGLLLFRRSPA